MNSGVVDEKGRRVHFAGFVALFAAVWVGAWQSMMIYHLKGCQQAALPLGLVAH
jgi:hypothetical protein